MRKVSVPAIAFMLVLSALAFAGNNPDVKCAVHVKNHDAKQGCTRMPLITTCVDINTTYPGCNFDAFPVFFDLVEYKTFEYAMCWPAEWIYSAAWTGCEDLVLGWIRWPAEGVTQTWYACQYDAVGLPGWAWLYAWPGPGRVCICPHPTSGEIIVRDCGGGIDNPMYSFCAGVYGYIGDNPCRRDGIEPSTWGGIKSIFE